MRKLGAVLCVAVLLSACLAEESDAQARRFGSPRSRRPVTSPYLELLRNNGRSTAFNYFREVRPELEFRRSNARQARSLYDLQRQVDRQGQLLQQRGNSELSPTGHTSSFLNLGSYFNSKRTGRRSFGR